MKKHNPDIKKLMELMYDFPEEEFRFEEATKRGKELLRNDFERIKSQKYPKHRTIHLGKEGFMAYIKENNPLVRKYKDKKILELIKKEKQVTVFELSKALGCSKVTAREHLESLVKKGIIVRSERVEYRKGVRGPIPIVYKTKRRK